MNQKILEGILEQYQTYLLVEKRNAENTIAHYMSRVHYFINFCFLNQHQLFFTEEWDLSAIDKRVVEIFNREHVTKKSWKESSVQVYERSIKLFLRFLVKKDYISYNPLKTYIIKPSIVSSSEEIEFPSSKIHSFFNIPLKSFYQIRNRLLFEFVYSMGMMPSKMARMTELKIIGNNRIHVCFKGKRDLEMPAGEDTIKLIESYMSLKNEEIPKSSDECFWVKKDGKGLTPGNISNILGKEISKLDEHLKPKDLRKMGALHFAENGADVRSIQTFQGSKRLSPVQEMNVPEFNDIQEIFKRTHLRNKV
ncbi:MAG: tyrosine-type recombinase/integrase [SAR324 cluster bacterium]|nr:tyrosine-type recombinase/integrase [SAR324 cluster bacterium]